MGGGIDIWKNGLIEGRKDECMDRRKNIWIEWMDWTDHLMDEWNDIMHCISYKIRPNRKVRYHGKEVRYICGTQ